MKIDARELLILSCIPGIGSVRLRSLINHFGSTHAVLKASAPELVAVEGIEKKTASGFLEFLRSHARADAERHADSQLSKLNKVDGRLVSFWCREYPRDLKKIFDPPSILFVRGELGDVDEVSMAVVGTRTPSAYGSRMASRFTRYLVEAGFTIVSGLARGIDTTAHTETLRSGGRTIAVIGSGVDLIYPSENTLLASRILKTGAIVSEVGMGAQPDAANFPRRNRIISGMSTGTLVVETGIEGGAMITATIALEQNREVFAVPGPIDEKRSSGTHLLIKEGRAKLVEALDDMLAELQPGMVSRLRIGQDTFKTPPPAPNLTLFEEKVYACIGSDPIHVDVIASRTGMGPSEILVHLLSLEFRELVKQHPGKFFVRT